MERLESLFRTHNLRLTTPRRALFASLAAAGMPLDIAAIAKQINGGDRTSIYRNIDLFLKLNIIQIIPVGWKKRYELAAPFAPHHHHLQCTICGKLTIIDAPKLEASIHALATSHDYQLSAHHIELQGICKNCQNKVE